MTESVAIFTCAFFSLLILGVTHAILAGRSGDAALGIAAHEQLLDGAALGPSTLLLLFGLRSVLVTYGRNRQVFLPARNVMLAMTALLGPVVSCRRGPGGPLREDSRWSRSDGVDP